MKDAPWDDRRIPPTAKPQRPAARFYRKEKDMNAQEFQTIATDYQKVKPHIRAILLPKDREEEVCTSGENWGFEDMVIVPRIFLHEEDGRGEAVHISAELVDMWEVTQNTVIDDAIQNIEYTIEPLFDLVNVLTGMGGQSVAGDMPVYVISNKERFYGAAGILRAGSKLKALFPDGYIILPSSIHEVIVCPGGSDDIPRMTEMVKDINRAVVQEDDVLSQRAYAR